ncbi:hypothetical protein AT01_714 [Yersinia aldovae 670-83]|nr:hypothetical protein [Yersinia aldovae]AJJ63498.1 hypothetical protein AT01_714 [Yersinia aldovae 670-83]
MTDDGQKIPQVYYWDGAVAASTDWVMPALTECADFSADDSHKNDDILDTMMDSIEIELIAGGSISYDKWV